MPPLLGLENQGIAYSSISAYGEGPTTNILAQIKALLRVMNVSRCVCGLVRAGPVGASGGELKCARWAAQRAFGARNEDWW